MWPRSLAGAVDLRGVGFSPQAFYKWRKHPVSDRDIDDAFLTNELIDAHADDPECA